FVGQVCAGQQSIDGGQQWVGSGGDDGLSEMQRPAVHLHNVRPSELGMAEVDIDTRLLEYMHGITGAALGTHATDPFHYCGEICPGWMIEAKAELGPAARIVNGASTSNERFAWRAAKIDARSAGQPLLRHGDAMRARRRGHSSDEAGRPGTQHHQVVLTASAVGPIRWVALANRLLVVNVRREKLDGRHAALVDLLITS